MNNGLILRPQAWIRQRKGACRQCRGEHDGDGTLSRALASPSWAWSTVGSMGLGLPKCAATPGHPQTRWRWGTVRYTAPSFGGLKPTRNARVPEAANLGDGRTSDCCCTCGAYCFLFPACVAHRFCHNLLPEFCMLPTEPLAAVPGRVGEYKGAGQPPMGVGHPTHPSGGWYLSFCSHKSESQMA